MQKKNEKTAIGYKYRILEILQRKTRAEEKMFRNLLPEKLNISPVTFNSWLYIKEDSGREIKAPVLFQIAEILSVEAIDLYNNPPTVFTLEDMKAEYEDSKNTEYDEL